MGQVVPIFQCKTKNCMSGDCEEGRFFDYGRILPRPSWGEDKEHGVGHIAISDTHTRAMGFCGIITRWGT